MIKKTANSLNNLILQELAQQPSALNNLAAFYLSEGGLELFPSVAGPVLFTGAGGSYNAARAGAILCRCNGVNAAAVEIDELAHWPAALFSDLGFIFYISPANEDDAIVSLLEKADHSRLAVITGEPVNPMARSAAVLLPLQVAREQTAGAQFFANSLALLWLLSRHLANQLDGEEAGHLKRLRQRVQVMVEAGDSLRGRWAALLPDPQGLILLGNDLHAVSASQASLLLAQTAGLLAPAFSFTAFAHGFSALLSQGSTAVVFQSSAEAGGMDFLPLAINSSGGRVIRVLDGFPQELHEPCQVPVKIDPGLSPILDVVSAQLLALQFANVDSK